MIVDDEYLVRLGLQRNIPWQELGIRVVGEAEDGESGLELIMELKPDLIITDIKMPFMDGIELMERARERRVSAQFIVLSGYGDFEYAKNAIRFGAAEYILKPVENAKFVEAVARVRDRIASDRTVARLCKEKLVADLVTVLKAVRTRRARPVSRTIDQAVQWIEEHYAEDLTVQSIALALHISPSYLMHMFKESMQTTILDYLTAYRMERAKRLLLERDYKVYEVSEKVGYGDSRYFGQLFKKHTGLTPREYIKSEMYE
jgi:two-component system response regulator YesN